MIKEQFEQLKGTTSKFWWDGPIGELIKDENLEEYLLSSEQYLSLEDFAEDIYPVKPTKYKFNAEEVLLSHIETLAQEGDGYHIYTFGQVNDIKPELIEALQKALDNIAETELYYFT